MDARGKFFEALFLVEEPNARALGSRLGIPADTDMLTLWVRIGQILAQGQPEFAGKRKKGRPSVGGRTLDYERYLVLHRRVRAEGLELGNTISQANAIRGAMDAGEALFKTQFEALEQSVSRGKTTYDKARRGVQVLRSQDFRAACLKFRERNQWIQEASEATERLEHLDSQCDGGFTLLDPRAIEREELMRKLDYPFVKISELIENAQLNS